MLELITYNYYHNKVFTTDFKLFCKLYKWNIGLYSLLALRKKICAFVFGMIGIALLILIKPILYGLVFIDLSLLFINIHIREITKAICEYDRNNSDEIVFTFQGKGFLRYQVRNMVGLLIKVGTSKIKPEKVKEILESKDRRRNGVTAPACGLCLVSLKLKEPYSYLTEETI